MISLKYAVRYLTRNAGFSAFAVIGLAIGLASCTVLFAIGNAAFGQYQGLGKPEQLAGVYALRTQPGTVGLPDLLSEKDVREWNTTHSQSIALHQPTTSQSESWPTRLRTSAVTPAFFTVLQAKAVKGRLFLPEDGSSPSCVAVVSSKLSHKGTGLSVGAVIRTNGSLCTVVGVVDRSGEFPEDAQVWAILPRSTAALDHAQWSGLTRFHSRASPASVGRFAIRPLLDASKTRLAGTGFRAVTVAVVLTLLMALVNVATFYLSRSNRRASEYALRIALGAGGRQVATQGALEVFVICGIAAVFGLVLTMWGARLAVSFLPDLRLDNAQLFDTRIIVFGIVVTLVTIAIVAATPLYQILTQSNAQILREGGSGLSASRRGAAVRQISLGLQVVSVLLLLAFGEACRTYVAHSAQLDVGIDASNVGIIALHFDDTDNTPENIDVESLLNAGSTFTDKRDKVAAWTRLAAPFNDPAASVRILPSSEPLPFKNDLWHYYEVTPSFFNTIGAKIVDGRLLTDQDKAESLPVIVVTESAAHLWWPNSTAIGKQVRLGSRSDLPSLTVVGVVRNMQSPDETGRDFVSTRPDATYPLAFIPWAQRALPTQFARSCFNCRTIYMGYERGSAHAQMKRVEQTLGAQFPSAHVTSGSLLELQLGSRTFSRTVLAGRVLNTFAIISALLALIGIWAASEESVRQLKRELGIRAALGATPIQMIQRAIAKNLGTAFIGVIIGCVSCLMGVRIMARFAGLPVNRVAMTPQHIAGLGLVLTLVCALTLLIAARGSLYISPRSVIDSK